MPTDNRNFYIAFFFGAIGFLFFMALIIFSILGYSVPCNDRYLIIIFLSLLLAFAAAIISGTLNLSGKINIPLLKDHPMIFNAASGFALFIFVFLIGDYVYINNKDCNGAPDNEEVTNRFISESQTLERNWLMININPYLCNNMDDNITELIAKLGSVSSSEVSYRTRIRKQLYVSRLNFFAATINKDIKLAISKLRQAEIEFVKAQKLSKELMSAGVDVQDDKDWFIKKKYAVKLLSNEIMLDVLNFKFTEDETLLVNASSNFKKINSQHASLLKKTAPMEDIFFEVIKTKNSKFLKNLCIKKFYPCSPRKVATLN